MIIVKVLVMMTKDMMMITKGPNFSIPIPRLPNNYGDFFNCFETFPDTKFFDTNSETYFPNQIL